MIFIIKLKKYIYLILVYFILLFISLTIDKNLILLFYL